MSILEIILYTIISLAVVLYITLSIVKMVKNRKKKNNTNDEKISRKSSKNDESEED